MTDSTDNKVVKTVRDAIVKAAVEMKRLKYKTRGLTHRVENNWKNSRPSRQKAKDDLKNAAHQVASFGKDVAQGVREGMAAVRRSGSEQ